MANNNNNGWLSECFKEHGRLLPALVIIAISMVSGLVGHNVSRAVLDTRLTALEAKVAPLEKTIPQISGDIREIRMDLQRLRESFERGQR